MRTLKIFIGILLLVELSAGCSNPSETIIFKGKYTGNNSVFVQNPITNADPNDTKYCIEKVIINEKEIVENPASAAFEIDLSTLNFKIGDFVSVSIVHSKDCQPRILNKPFE